MKFILATIAFLLAHNAMAFVDVVTSASNVCVTPTITAGAYAEGDAVGGQMDFDVALGQERKTGVVQSLTISDNSEAKDILTIYCFDQEFTEVADNAAVSYSIADVSHAVLSVSVAASDWIELGGGNIAHIKNIGKVVSSSDTTLRCQLETSSAPTYNDVNELTVCIDILKDSP